MAVKKYIKFDSEKGYLANKDDINYFSTNQMRKVAFGKMLGDFDENGLYVINSKIVDELIRMPKVIVEIIDGTDLIRSTIKADSFFHFILTVEDNKAKFKLLEKIHYQSNRDFNSGLYSNINEYVLDEVIVTDRDFDRNVLYQKYNISTENNNDALSIFDMDELSLAMYFNLVEKLKVNYLVQNALMIKEKKLEAIESNYFESVLAILGEFNDFGKQVTDGVKKDLAEKHTFVIASKPFFQHTVNELMDSHIEMFIQSLSPEQRQEFEARHRQAKGVFYEQFKKIIPIEILQKSGVRFDANQILQEGVIGSLVQEIQTKGFTSSDVRKIIINEGELQLPISKIKEMVDQNEEVAKRDNARSKDILAGREHTTKFYKELEKENKVNVLTPDTTLIKDKIENQQEKVKVDEQKKTTESTQEVMKVQKVAKTPVPRQEKAVGGTKVINTQPPKIEKPKEKGTTSGYGGYTVNYDYSGGFDYTSEAKTSATPSKNVDDSNNKKINSNKKMADVNLFISNAMSGDTTKQQDVDTFIRR